MRPTVIDSCINLKFVELDLYLYRKFITSVFKYKTIFLFKQHSFGTVGYSESSNKNNMWVIKYFICKALSSLKIEGAKMNEMKMNEMTQPMYYVCRFLWWDGLIWLIDWWAIYSPIAGKLTINLMTLSQADTSVA